MANPVTDGVDEHALIDPELFKKSMGHWTTGVAVVTTVAGDGSQHGFTANSFTAVSIDPPTILVCLDRKANSLAAFSESSWLVVNILGRAQADIARVFARKHPDKFSGLVVRKGLTGGPLLTGAVAALECRLTERLSVGDHVILLAEVLHAATGDDEPLVYHRSRFRDLGPGF
jgi:flavin reductase ActVB